MLDELRQQLMRLAGIWRAILGVVLALVAAAAAVAHGVPAFPVVILFADLLVFWHLRLIAAERRREAVRDQVAFDATALELSVVKSQHRDRLSPAQASLPFNQWVAGIRAGGRS